MNSFSRFLQVNSNWQRFCFSHQKYYGRKSSVGRDVCRLRKAYYSARHEAAVQIDEIVGETASEADSSDSLERDHGHHNHGGSHDKDDDVIRCICGMYKDEGLMIQCEKCMVRVFLTVCWVFLVGMSGLWVIDFTRGSFFFFFSFVFIFCHYLCEENRFDIYWNTGAVIKMIFRKVLVEKRKQVIKTIFTILQCTDFFHLLFHCIATNSVLYFVASSE